MPDCSLLVMLAATDDQCPDSLICQALQNHGILIISFLLHLLDDFYKQKLVLIKF